MGPCINKVKTKVKIPNLNYTDVSAIERQKMLKILIVEVAL